LLEPAQVSADRHHRADAGTARPCDHAVEIIRKGWEIEVAVTVD
jgi:hypothetical protein